MHLLLMLCLSMYLLVDHIAYAGDRIQCAWVPDIWQALRNHGDQKMLGIADVEIAPHMRANLHAYSE